MQRRQSAPTLPVVVRLAVVAHQHVVVVAPCGAGGSQAGVGPGQPVCGLGGGAKQCMPQVGGQLLDAVRPPPSHFLSPSERFSLTRSSANALSGFHGAREGSSGRGRQHWNCKEEGRPRAAPIGARMWGGCQHNMGPPPRSHAPGENSHPWAVLTQELIGQRGVGAKTVSVCVGGVCRGGGGACVGAGCAPAPLPSFPHPEADACIAIFLQLPAVDSSVLLAVHHALELDQVLRGGVVGRPDGRVPLPLSC